MIGYSTQKTGVDHAIGEDYDKSSIRFESQVYFPNLTPEIAKDFLDGKEVDKNTEASGTIRMTALGQESKKRIEIAVFDPSLSVTAQKDKHISLTFNRGNDAMLANVASVVGFKVDSVAHAMRRSMHENLEKSARTMLELQKGAHDKIGREMSTSELQAMTVADRYGFEVIADEGRVYCRNTVSETTYTLDNEQRWQSAMFLDEVPKMVINALNKVKGIEIEAEKHFNKKLGIEDVPAEPELDAESKFSMNHS